MNSTVKGSTMGPSPHDKYQAEDDCRTLARAEEVKMDKKRHSAARDHAAKQAKAHLRVAGVAASDLMKGHSNP